MTAALLDKTSDTVKFVIEVDKATFNTNIYTDGMAQCENKREVTISASAFLLALARQHFGQDIIEEILAQPLLTAERDDE